MLACKSCSLCIRRQDRRERQQGSRILVGAAATLALLLAVASLMTAHPEIGALVAEYNRF